MPEPNTEAYDKIVNNPFHLTAAEPLSTFSIDVAPPAMPTCAAFSVRRCSSPGCGTHRGDVNYFAYHDASSKTSAHPFAVHVEVVGCPWNAQHRMARIGIAARPIDQAHRPASNLVFLVDVSGSMQEPNKLPLVQWSLELPGRTARRERSGRHRGLRRRFGIGAATDLVHAQSGNQVGHRPASAGGSTNGGAGIQLAYDLATQHFIKNGTNRVILGDRQRL